VDVAEGLEVDIGELPDHGLDGGLEALVGEEGRLRLSVAARCGRYRVRFLTDPV
jgi:hypothetical protein